jgi:peptide/nickel transport system substrate-binding protein
MKTPPQRGRRSGRLIALSVSVAVLAAACRAPDVNSTASSTTAEPRNGGSVVMAVERETDGWQPQLSQWAGAAYWAGSAVIEPLATFDEHGETVMWLADSITPTVPGQFDSWLIKVKPNISFHNGEKLDSSVLMANFGLITNGKSLTGLVLGPKFKAFTPVDDLTVRVDINGPWADFPAFMAGSTGMVTAKEQINAPFGGVNHPIGTGPFVFESWTPNESFKATKNPTYWRTGEPHLDSIEFRPIVDNKKALSALQNGDIDMMVTTKAEDVTLAGPDMATATDYKTEKTFVQINTAQPLDGPPNPLTNLHARRALAYGTDRAAIRTQVGSGQTLETSTQPMVAGTPWAVPEDQTGYPAYDIDKAKTEVAAYQTETADPTIEFELSTSPAPDDLAVANTLADQWKAIGITANVKAKETQANTVDLVFGNYQASVMRNFGYPNPDTDVNFFASAHAKGPGNLSVNMTQVKDPVIDAAAAHAATTTDRTQQRHDWLTITRQINDQAANQWLYDTPYTVIHTPAIHGLESLDTHTFASAMPRPWLWGNVWRD